MNSIGIKSKEMKYLLYFLFLIPYFMNASQKDVNIFADYIKNDVFDLNEYSLKQTIKIHLKNNKKIKAFTIYENGEIFSSGYVENSKIIYENNLPQSILNLNRYISDITFDNSIIGKIAIYQDDNINTLSFTSKEQDYIKNKKEITMCIDPNWMPYEGIENGKYIGIGAEYIKLFSKKLNIDFKLIKTKTWQESKENAKAKVCDILPLSSSSDKRKEFMHITRPHLQEAIVLVTKMNENFIVNLEELKNKKIGITNGYSIIKTFKLKYPYLKLIETQNIQDGLKMVAKGKLFGQIDAISTMNYYIQKEFPDKLKISSKLNDTYDLGIASSKDDIILHNIFQKLVSSISDEEHNKIYYKWNSERLIVKKSDYTMVFQLLTFFILIIFLILYWNRKLKKAVDARTLEIKLINESLEEKIRTEVEKNRQNELKVLEQAKQASLGDMIGNIAHQWRQPLSIISLASTGALFQYKMGMLNDKIFEEEMNLINNNAQYLSKTIDTFRDFLSESKEIREVDISERVESSLNIVSAALHNHQIKLIKNFNPNTHFKMKMVADELPQVIINIINNAKDILVEKKIDKAWISINIVKKNNNISIIIEDNGGGVPEKILPKIFEPYFTTKHKSNGTGLGLHMSYRIIVESLKGNIYCENTLCGAKFTIELPLAKS